ncbi:Hormonally up-regulated neu tumor-associated kinase [Araneus ventricosus]|uniref:Hormonally up-regulated neu tumor-associated kinase n=1 Tax=Araneus ventricosus TaxID=182803 RepID=A0A4Y2JSW5_ARAVE|nr:Hormonally up-regulated neu tumor-associated kinase [Araneus ventricosus]
MQVALKVIDRKNIKEDYVLRNLQREAKILRKLNHPNIVNFYEEFSHNELYCLAMEHINGPDLHHYLQKQVYRRVSEKTAKVFFYQMVSAVHHMHRANILHRDLKQENILLEYEKVIKIVDFGLSNTYQPKVLLRTHCGSLVYAAPELFQQHSVYGAGVDLWSLGVILYAMVVGSMPFEVSKDIKSSISQSNKERFLRRISKGLTEENWENMGNLSYGCSNLLENLLQPDQFKRIRIEGVRQHPWFLNDEGFRKRLPQHRMDLKRKFEPEIIDIMADRLHQPKSRIRMHLITRDKYDRVSAMFFILQDTLVKEVLYPPKDLENSFIYQLECRRKSQSSAKQELPDDEQDQECEEEDESSEFSVGKSSRCFSTSKSTFVSHNFIHEAPSKPEIQETKKNFSEMGNMASIRKRIGDGGHLEKKTSERNITRTKPWMPKADNPSSNVKSSIPKRIEDQRLMPTYPEAGYRYRSYKNNRPTRVAKDNTFTGRREERSEFEKRSEENDHREIDSNRSDFSNYSIKSNFQGEVKSLKEKFEKDCTIASQNIDQRNHNLRNQRRTATLASNPVHSQPITVKRLTNVDKYTAQQMAQIQKRYTYRPSTNERSIKSSQTNPIHTNKSYQECLVNPTASSHNQKEAPQMKQRSMVIRRSNASNSSHSGNTTAANRGQYGLQRAYTQKPTFDASKNVSNYETKRLHKAPPSAISKREDPAKNRSSR